MQEAATNHDIKASIKSCLKKDDYKQRFCRHVSSISTLRLYQYDVITNVFCQLQVKLKDVVIHSVTKIVKI